MILAQHSSAVRTLTHAAGAAPRYSIGSVDATDSFSIMKLLRAAGGRLNYYSYNCLVQLLKPKLLGICHSPFEYTYTAQLL